MWTGVAVCDGLRENSEGTVDALWDVSRKQVVWHGCRHVFRLLLPLLLDVAFVDTHSKESASSWLDGEYTHALEVQEGGVNAEHSVQVMNSDQIGVR